ncbi:MAG: hypothetical protein AB1631_10990 [Acidobacteriota bacterium]
MTTGGSPSASCVTKGRHEPGRAIIYVSNGMIYNRGEKSLWVAIRQGDNSIHFAPKENARNSFSFTRESPDVWIARLLSLDSQGRQVETLYRMKRIKP